MKKYFALLFAAASLFSSCLDDNFEDEKVIPYYESNLEYIQEYYQGKTYYNGEDGSGKIQDGIFIYTNNYNAEWGSWDGFALSCSESTRFSADNYLTDQYNCCTLMANSRSFLVGYYSEWSGSEPTIYTVVSKTDLTRRPFIPLMINITNAAYTLNSMLNGDDYAKKFGTDDYLHLYITGYKDGKETKSLKIPLAEKGSFVRQWGTADLQSLGTVDEIRFKMDSSDKGEWGINTPCYFCIDNLRVSFPNATPIN